MKALIAVFLALPLLVQGHVLVDERLPALDDEITIVMVNDVAQVSGPNKILIEVFDAYWSLVAVEDECTPITVYVDLSSEPDGTYHVRVTTTTGTVTRTVQKG